ncbi:prepilin peptidase [Meiothermus sp. QL-1]|uniref:prepilin peptidase n=1 Tax=Meiothermus sp. QL-1 TaxID=2058095 RepID=UPI000E0AD66F|nr:prepilin peptidase [Meiothermus sp. QL-1]RDI96758.1 prepilin peptidase [Meiothermus sp. QL-1]
MWLVYAFLFGSLIGSFLNVVIYRLPKGLSVVRPRSSCPHCGHTLTPVELLPLLSWLLQRGRCRRCRGPISPRYPLVEALTAFLFALSAYLLGGTGGIAGVLLVWAFIALLIALAFIDIDTKTLPNSLNFAGVFLGLMAAWALGFPQGFSQALEGGLLAAGLLALLAGYGGLIYNRFKDSPREGPFGVHQVHLAAMGGAWGGMWGTAGGVYWGSLGLLLGFLNAALNARTARVLALPDGLTLGLAALAPLAALLLQASPLESLRGMLLSAGGLALAGMLYWWIRNPSDKVEADNTEESGYVSVMGYGDVVLAGFLGVWLGFAQFLVALLIAVLAGAVLGLLAQRFGRGGQQIPFGPYLAVGGVVAFFYGEALLRWYLAYLGLG